MEITGFEFNFADKYPVSGKPKLCWTCLKKYEDGYMVQSTNKLRRIFFCKDCLEKGSS